jgi:RNA polymerase sigma-70 factor (ECF subfamily)
VARSRLDEDIRRKVDAEDVLQSVYRSYFARQRRGQFELAGWENLWSILTLLTLRKCANQGAHFQATFRDVRREVNLGTASEPASDVLAAEPSPSEAAVLTEVVEELLRGLDDRDREIVTQHLQGDTVAEISDRVGWAEHTVHRTLDRVRKRPRRIQASP